LFVLQFLNDFSDLLCPVQVRDQKGVRGVNDQTVFQAKAGHQPPTMAGNKTLLTFNKKGFSLYEVPLRIMGLLP
jgi:hypothetical protein